MPAPRPEALPRSATEPEAVIIELISALEPDLPVAVIDAALTETIKLRPHRRALAALLLTDPDLLTSGRPAGTRQLDRLIGALAARGSRHLQLPRCAECSVVKPLTATRGTQRICYACWVREFNARNRCVVCGNIGFASRDRHGAPRCGRCPPDGGQDPMEALCHRIEAIPVELPRSVIADAVRATSAQLSGQRRLLWAIEDIPGLLTGEGAKGPARALALIQNLLDAGARNVVLPACPFCGSAAKLARTLEGLRCCRRCVRRARTADCVRCNRRRPIGGRTLEGQPICESCRQADPLNHQPCTNCGRVRLIVERSESERLCGTCYTPPAATCSICGQHRPCRFAATDSPQCLSCHRERQPREECASCGKQRPVNYRHPDGRPYCKTCGEIPHPCSSCGNTRLVASRTSDGKPLCRTCYHRHPSSHRTCTECGVRERLFHHGLCTACVARQSLRDALSGPDGHMRPELEPIFHALLRTGPNAILDWVRRSEDRRIVFEALATGSGPVTHETLDRLRPTRTVRSLRAALTAGGALPARDERLVELQTWLDKTLPRLQEPAERRRLHSYVTWHHLRRIRKNHPDQPITISQAAYVKHEVRAAVRFLEWLHTKGSSLNECTQHDIDDWLEDGTPQRLGIRGFLLWTARQGHTRPLHVPARPSDFIAEVISQDQRWSLVRRLLHDENLQTVDRAAGLLLLLFAQSPSRIAQLTTDQVTTHDGRVTLQLGQVPLELPPPVDDLVLQLVARRRGHSATVPLEEPGWLFPGGYPGQPITGSGIQQRLNRIGIRPRPSRQTTLMDLAAELPTPVISRLLGIHQQTADRWHREAGASQAGYAAELTRR